jgi:hypothetical protein
LSTWLTCGGAQAADLSVSPNKRYLLKDGKPFFYLCDTAWDLFMKLNREQADDYLKNRTDKGFNVVMSMLIGWHPSEDERNAYGEPPLTDKDPARPNENYFQHVDYIVNKANSLGMVVAIAPSWADWMYKGVGRGPHPFNVENARRFGEYVGRRYRDSDIVWIIGGDYSPEGYEDILRAMAAGLDEGDGGRDFLMTFHGNKEGGMLMPPENVYYQRLGSAHLFGADAWLDFHGAYSGHAWAYPTYRLIAQDRALRPTRPIIDLEPCYENHPYIPDGSRYHADRGKWDKTTRGTSAMIRKQGYWAMLAGAAGHTYAGNEVWGFYDPAHPRLADQPYHFNTHWSKALDFSGAFQMGIMRRLFESRPWQTLEPDQSIVVAGQGSASHVQAARAADGGFLFVYVPQGDKLTIEMTKIRGSQAKAYWFNPRDGTAKEIGKFPCSGTREFSPPSRGLEDDWVLVLDAETQNFTIPGTPSRSLPPARTH